MRVVCRRRRRIHCCCQSLLGLSSSDDVERRRKIQIKWPAFSLFLLFSYSSRGPAIELNCAIALLLCSNCVIYRRRRGMQSNSKFRIRQENWEARAHNRRAAASLGRSTLAAGENHFSLPSNFSTTTNILSVCAIQLSDSQPARATGFSSDNSQRCVGLMTFEISGCG